MAVSGGWWASGGCLMRTCEKKPWAELPGCQMRTWREFSFAELPELWLWLPQTGERI